MKYKVLAEVYEKLESTTKRLEKTFVLSEFLKSAKELDNVMLLVQGRVFPLWDQRELGVAGKIVLKTISVATGAALDKIETVWKQTGDLGKVAEELTKTKTQATLFSQDLTVKKVFNNLRKLPSLEGAGTVDRKTQVIAKLLTSASPKEAKYIVRTVLGELRIGLGEGTVRDSIVWAFFADKAGISYDKEKNDLIFEKDRKEYEKYVNLVQEAIDVVNDFAEIAKIAKEKGESGLQALSLTPGHPVKVMLFQKSKDIDDAFDTVGKPAACEFKYDGFRMQIHKYKNKIRLFTRRLEEVTHQFPDVVEKIKNNVKGSSFVIDAEIIGIDSKTKKSLPFQNISQRIKRKYDIEDMAKKFPVEVNVFDILFYEKKSLLKTSFVERRKLLEKIVTDVPHKIKCAEQLTTDDASKANKFYKSSLDAGNEGIMMKSLDSIYKPGSRVGFGVKVKPTMDTLEVVIVGAEWGEGKRSAWLASFVVAIRNPETNEFLEIGKVGTGIKEKVEEGVSFEQLTKLLEPIVIEEKGREVKVKPRIVIEVDYEEIQKSPTYASGWALRFPRLCKLREDRSPEDVNTLSEIKSLAKAQRGRSTKV